MREDLLNMDIEALIDSVEKTELMKAPMDLKSSILKKAAAYEAAKRKREWQKYAFKVCAGMAAALMLTFSFDMERLAQNKVASNPKVSYEQQVEQYRQDKIGQIKHTKELKEKIQIGNILNQCSELLKGGSNEE